MPATYSPLPVLTADYAAMIPVSDDCIIPDRRTALAYLMRDGNLSVPAGRYGSDTADCAPVAYRLAYIMARETGEPLTVRALDSDMGLVVNSHDDVAYTLRNYGGRWYGR